MIAIDSGTLPTAAQDPAYDLMQETNGHYDHVPLDATDDSQAKRLGWLWHSEHHGQTVITRNDPDGRTNIVSVLGL
jgi:hypothetical protein